MSAQTTGETVPFEIQDDTEFRLALYSVLMDAMPGDPFLMPMHARASALTRHERLFLAVHIFDTEAFNEGVLHFFLYDCGDLYEYVIEGLNAIGMPEFALQLQAYVKTIFGEEYPLASDARQERLLSVERHGSDAFSGYYETSERLSERLVAWARANRTHFWRGVFHPTY